MRGIFWTSASAIALLGATPVLGQDATESRASAQSSGGVNTIIVTANRREENLQDVGISIAAFDGEQLEALQVTTAGDVASITPNIEIVRSYASPGFNTQITIRGVGQPDFQDTTEAVVTSYVDEFYMVGAGQADFLAFDIERVEVARGPQGTVQGRNSTAGSINYSTNKPDTSDTSAQASITLGEYGLVRTSGFLNVPLSDNFAVRGAFSTDNSDGYITNINEESPWKKGGKGKFRAGRIQARYEGSTFDLNLKAEFGRMGPVAGGNEEGLPTGPIPGRVGTFRLETDALGQNEENIGAGEKYVVNSDGPNTLNAKMEHYLARLNVDASEDLSFSLIAGYLKNEKDEVEDCDHTPTSICLFSNLSESEHWMTEARANYDGGNFRIVGGVNYLDQELDVQAVTPLFWDLDFFAGAGLYTQYFRDLQDLKSWAVFGQVEVDLTDKLTLIAGARYTKDDKELDSFDTESIAAPVGSAPPETLAQFFDLVPLVLNDPAPLSVTTLNPEDDGDQAVFNKGLVGANLQLNYKPNEDVLVYASYRRGVKSGGFITGNVAGTPANLRKYGEETNNAYELGLKSTLANGQLRLNGAVFYYDYKDLQHTSLIGITNVITNNDTEVWGGELELQASLYDGLTLAAGIGYVDSSVEGINNPTGDVPKDPNVDSKLPLSPKWSGNFFARYEWEAMGGYPFVQISGRGRTKMFRDSLNNASNTIEGGFTTDARIGYTSGDDRWTLAFWVNNLFDSNHEINAFDISAVLNVGEIVYNPPRWFGGTFTIRM